MPNVQVTMAIALHRPGFAAIAQTAKKAVQFFVENRLNGAADVRAQPILDRIEAFVASE
jgi:hypothetical protein